MTNTGADLTEFRKISLQRMSLAVWHNWKERLPFFPRPFRSTNPLLSWSPRQHLLAGSWGHPVRCSRRCTWPRTLVGAHVDNVVRVRHNCLSHFHKKCSFVCYLLRILRASSGTGRDVFHWVGSRILQSHWKRQSRQKKKTLSWKWNHLHCDDCSICVLDIVNDYYGHLAVQHVYTHTDLLNQFSSPCIFAARCCTNWGCHSGRDELDITFGEPASLSGLQLT